MKCHRTSGFKWDIFVSYFSWDRHLTAVDFRNQIPPNAEMSPIAQRHFLETGKRYTSLVYGNDEDDTDEDVVLDHGSAGYDDGYDEFSLDFEASDDTLSI